LGKKAQRRPIWSGIFPHQVAGPARPDGRAQTVSQKDGILNAYRTS
jgi:hypothetical protein